EEKTVGPISSEGGEESQFLDADILRLVDDHEVKDGTSELTDPRRQTVEHRRWSDEPPLIQLRLRRVEDRPERTTMLFRQACFSSEALHVAIAVPRIELPGINHCRPLGAEKCCREPLWLPDGRRCLRQDLPSL